MLNTPLRDANHAVDFWNARAHHERVWNILIPKCAVKAEVIPEIGVRYLHPTKGYRYVGKRRFAIRGVI